jgi:hypothetical protein
VSEPTVRRRTYAAGEAALQVDAAERAQIEQTLPEAPVAPAKLQVSIDATKVSILHGGWTDMKLAAFGELVPTVGADGTPDVKATALSYVVRWEPAETFAATLTTEAYRRGVDRAGVVASPNDGAEWIQGVLDLIAPAAIRILDEPHAAEHLGTIAGLVFGAGSAEATIWQGTQRETLLTQPDGVARVLAELARCLDQGPRPGTPATAEGLPPAEVLAREVAYFQTRADQVRYAHFRQAGLPIGSGIAESGHKVTTAARMKQAGQHWAPVHLNPMGALRSLVASDRWEEAWPAIWAQARATAQAQRQARHDQRRTARLTLVPSTPLTPPPEAPPGPIPDDPTPVREAQTEPPVVALALKASPDPAPSGPAAPTPRRPAPDHPWRRPFLAPRQRRAG